MDGYVLDLNIFIALCRRIMHLRSSVRNGQRKDGTGICGFLFMMLVFTLLLISLNWIFILFWLRTFFRSVTK